MEAKLEAYRTRKRREAMVEKAKNSIKGVLSWQEQPVPLLSKKLEDRDDLESITSEESIDVSPQRNSTITQVIYFIYFLLWATLYVIALQFEFGAVYFILSALVFIWKNTRSGPKKKGEVSAYSVFNPNCEAIQGSINMEQIEREMGWGTHS
ncbi:SAYSvFN domain-containing protein 1 [Diachasma alloeum]|uniref:SAYSvFN domain-containing protein 1 n=1 Tax=Diachasma alloeum TaxID=454923 RepID=UPI0007383476|nr:SAYSvFN domain-containing protein 1 [Diachasma alloeum]